MINFLVQVQQVEHPKSINTFERVKTMSGISSSNNTIYNW